MMKNKLILGNRGYDLGDTKGMFLYGKPTALEMQCTLFNVFPRFESESLRKPEESFIIADIR